MHQGMPNFACPGLHLTICMPLPRCFFRMQLVLMAFGMFLLLFHDENMIGASNSLTVGVASNLMLLVFMATMRPYRRHYQMMETANAYSP
jgi:hypothetical protein